MHGTVVAHPLRHRPGRVPRIRDHLGRRTRLGGLAAVADLHRLAERRGEPLARCDRRRRGGRRDAAVLRLERGGELPSGDADYQTSIDYSLTIPDWAHRLRGNDKYAGLDLVRDDWPAEPIDSGPFVIEWYATTPHNPSVFRAHLTTPDWNPAQPLNWNQLEEIETAAPTLDDGTYLIPTTLPERIGRHALVVIGNASTPWARGSTRSATSTSGTATKCASARPT